MREQKTIVHDLASPAVPLTSFPPEPVIDTPVDNLRAYADKYGEKPLDERVRDGVYARKDFTIFQNDVLIHIKVGEDLTRKNPPIPERFWENLKTEGVI